MDFDGDEYIYYDLQIRTERIPRIGDGYFIVHRNITNEEPKNNVKFYTITKYNFYNNSVHICPYCYENFKKNDNICINFCYHYWCETCHKNLKSNKCGFCRQNIFNNDFIDSLGETGFFEKSNHSLDLIKIIKDDIDLIQIENNNDSIDKNINNDNNNNKDDDEDIYMNSTD